MAKYDELNTQILANVGGKENIANAVHCMTRLRLSVKDKSKVDLEAVKAVKGVLGAQFSGDQFQIIIGQHVSEVYPEFCAMAGVAMGEAIEENLDKEPFDIKKVPSKVLDVVSGTMAPLIPIMIGAGFFKMFYAILGPDMLGLLPEDNDFMQILYIVGQTGFYFLPIFSAYSAAKKFKTDISLALMLGALLIAPEILAIVEAGEPFKIYSLIPMQLNNYTQTFIPTLLTVWIMSYVNGFFKKYVPNSIKVIGVPFCTLFIMIPLMFCVLAPIGNWISVGLAAVINTVYTAAGPVAIMLIGAFWMFLVATGMHIAIIQLAVANILTLGFDPVILAGSNIANYALMGMVVAYFLRTKGEEKQLAGANVVTLLVGGISEPTLFGVLLRNKRAMICQIIGGGIGGLIGGILGVKVYVFATSNLLNVLSYVGPGNNFICAVIACAAAFVSALVTGLIIGFGTPGEGEGLGSFKKKDKKAIQA